jgi:ABC-type lipoprotein export system ATPase subunit
VTRTTHAARVSAETPLLAGCTQLSVGYGSGDSRVTALESITVSLLPHETVALWGPSGSGKTTLLHALGGLVEPTSGQVLWEGEPLSSLDASARANARRHGIAYVFQGSNLLPTFTAWENVAFAAHASQGNDINALALEALTLVGLESKAESLPSELSGGEAQRIAIARALAQRPRLLLCDEPTGHLDTDTTARVLEMINALQVRFAFTLVVATHEADVASLLGRTIELRDGRIVGEKR